MDRGTVGREGTVIVNDQPAGGDAALPDIQLRARTGAVFGLAVFGVAIVGAGGAVYLIIMGPPPGLLLPLLLIAIMVVVMDIALTGASPSHYSQYVVVRIGITGVSVPIRRETEYQRYKGRYALRSVILGRRLGDFDRPNFVAWYNNGGVTLTIRRSRAEGGPLTGGLDFRGGPFQNGPIEFMGRLQLTIPAPAVSAVVRRVLNGGGHVHIAAKLAEEWGIPLTSCPDIPGYIPRLGGACLPDEAGLPAFGGPALGAAAGVASDDATMRV